MTPQKDTPAGSVAAPPTTTGVGRLSLRAVGAGSWRRSPRLAVELLDRWSARTSGPAAEGTSGFPFEAVLGHFQAVGRNQADPDLIERLRVLAGSLPPPRTVHDRILANWLPGTFDHEDGNYDSYAAIPLLEELAGADGPDRIDAGLDGLIVALLADLLRFEATGLRANPNAAKQRARTQATFRALVRAGEIAPLAEDLLPSIPSSDTARGDRELAAADAVLTRVAEPVRHAVRIAMLPTTNRHDEVMFIRSVQTFELLYRRIARGLERAVSFVDGGEPSAAIGEVTEAADKIAATTLLYRVLTTMPRESFAEIRANTSGRSAIQSRAYREIELRGAPIPPNPQAPPLSVEGISLQEVFTAMPGGPAATALAAAMRNLDDAWRGMKRTHWGITLKIIGQVPGTGGTSGADYLRIAADQPLFPVLHPGTGEQDGGVRIA
ncbi:hypothetical protein ACFORH_04745 [Amycolatopsis roodepoortensis]|uniref:Tryptophan 2,3-dioxygenase n=1 Tax=Amycolatopsis roodepoortensis TaxID=700274 RepID=A0ABR9L7I4_9PSEU|nr:hypothetical protein [Amycolatopsis roodepoortensis]MBE1576312.1 tryptophan 2,3-dioxygenase [Amycolatopsis roodepoortensis]